MTMPNDDILSARGARSPGPRPGKISAATFRGAEARGPIIDQEGREIPREALGETLDPRFQGLGHHLTREQRLARLDAMARLLDIAFVVPGTSIRYGIDGIINLIPVVGDIVTAAISLWLVREARALGAPWHVVARMLGNVAIQGVAATVPLAGDAFDVLFRANIRNVKLLRRWMDKQTF
jgi:hypothetical protein